uniref:PIPK domain-containing protein n=1 Tax=Bionectria ochroleuca TaxID=29856 RepID=A0A8H7NIR8_BIOOC
MPEVLTEGQSRPGFVFNEDDGGFRATHEDNAPADEIYYLGVIDCLTHYGMIKKIEHFWKGLTSDKTQISALPPAQYGDRFYNFVEGNTMSVEEAKREEARLKAQEVTQSLESTIKPPKHHSIPPMPDHQPPAPPPGGRSPEGRETVEMASREAQRTEAAGMSEKHVPDRTLRAAVPYSDKRESLQREPILPSSKRQLKPQIFVQKLRQRISCCHQPELHPQLHRNRHRWLTLRLVSQTAPPVGD